MRRGAAEAGEVGAGVDVLGGAVVVFVGVEGDCAQGGAVVRDFGDGGEGGGVFDVDEEFAEAGDLVVG